MKYWMLWILGVSVIFGCDTDIVYEKNLPVNYGGWDIQDTLVYDCEVPDSNSQFDLSINIRHRDIFQYMNVYLNVLTILPSGTVKSQTISIPLCDDAGKWLGKCSGDICFQRVFIMRKFVFSEKGTYQFRVSHEMRMDELKDIFDLGLRLEKSKKRIHDEA
jgi:gliding motility-associated lipoprotein GldH